ncbi:MAG TPA: two-component regulator propeller domain-containing protein [Chitinophagaceae bacterium]|nr:two-component regulator propeller domain-containing protein [Chitinophagaceae bacterium]
MRLNQFITILFLLLAYPALSQKQDLKFDHFSTANGLSQSNVACILQDSRGFMWFGTRDGLNRYDGYTFTVYRNIAGDSASLDNNYVNHIIEDSDGIIWVATNGGGISGFDRKKNTFKNYRHDDRNPASIASNYVNYVFADSRGNIWAGTDGGGLDKLNKATGKFTHYAYKPGDASGVGDNFIRSIQEDREHNLWVGTVNKGLDLFDPATNTFTHFQHDYKNPSSLSNNDVYFVYEDSHDRTWVGTNGGGLNLFNRQAGTFTHFVNDPHNPNSLPANSLYDIYEDEKGDLWLGTENGGLSIFNPVTKNFSNYVHDDIDDMSIGNNSIYAICRDTRGDIWLGTFNAGVDVINADKRDFKYYRHSTDVTSVSSNKILCIYEDSKTNIWVGTDGGGLNMLDTRTDKFTHFTHETGNGNSICGNYVLHVMEDNNKNLWIGTWADGLSVYNPAKKTFKTYVNNPADSGSLSGNNVWFTYQDRENNIWIGTYGNGLNLYDAAKDKFVHYRYDPKDPYSISSDKVYSIFEDRKGRLWIGTESGGLNMFDRTTGRFIHYKHDDHTNSISDNSLETIFEDNNGKLWIATTTGLNYFDPDTKTFKVYTTANGLPNNIIFGILEDDKNNLWVSTNKGLTKFNPQKNTFEKFTTADGLQGDEFKEMAFCKTRAGNMYFGGNNGFNYFNPDSIKKISFDPPLVFTDFRLFNQSVGVSQEGAASPLTQSISETKNITISYKQSVIALQFASLNYCPSGKKRYQYMLEGFDNQWTEIGSARTAYYTNLDPGSYIFKVRGLDNEGNWSAKQLSLNLTITPPFWETWWFRVLAVIAFIAAIVAVFRIRLRLIQQQKASLEKQVRERTVQLATSIEQEKKARQNEETARVEAERANRAKSVFLATMSHEIRTPLNGVIGMSSLLADTELTPEQEEYATTIKSCGESLMSVINDILDFSKIESGNMELEKQDFDLRSCIEEVLDVFATVAAKNGIDLVYQIDHNVPSQIVGDMHRLRQVLMNLVGNAIKFTHKGEVFIGVHLAEQPSTEYLNIGFEVRDTGIGIPADKAHRLFKAFSQVDSSTTRKYGGTGLGLVICQKLVMLMGGDIEVESRVGEGTTFHFNIISAASAQPQRKYVHYNNPELAGKHILIVDDNSTNRRILDTQLEHWALVPILAASGREALEKLQDGYHFDLVITDMHMPEMDGIELSRLIKQAQPNLPVILLSSIGDEHSRQFPKLFTAVLHKPIKQQALYKCIINTLKTREKQDAVTNAGNNIKNHANLAELYPLQILIAEDNVINQRLMIHVLNKLGYAPHLAEDGQQVLEKVVADNFDVIFMDVQMPEIDGLETTRIIRRQQQAQPVIIAMTANATKEDKQDCLSAGMDDYISKPIQLNKLVTMIENWAKLRKEIKNDSEGNSADF